MKGFWKIWVYLVSWAPLVAARPEVSERGKGHEKGGKKGGKHEADLELVCSGLSSGRLTPRRIPKVDPP